MTLLIIIIISSNQTITNMMMEMQTGERIMSMIKPEEFGL